MELGSKRLALAAAFAVTLTGPVAAKEWRITYVMGLTASPFYNTVACGGAAEARRLGVVFDAQGPAQYQPALQLRVLDAVVASHPDGLLFSHDDPVALTPTLLQAKQMGIKVISLDGELADTSVSLSNIQSDNAAAGREAAIQLARLIGDKGKVLAVTNSPAALVAQLRLNGFTEEIAKHKNIEYLGVQYSNNVTAKAASIVNSTIAAHPDLSAVFTATTNNSEGAATAVRQAQLVGKITIVGFDTSDPIVELIRNGVISAEIVQAPYQIGEQGVRMMVDALNGHNIEREIRTPFVVATPSNIDTAEIQKYIYKTRCDDK